MNVATTTHSSWRLTMAGLVLAAAGTLGIAASADAAPPEGGRAPHGHAHAHGGGPGGFLGLPLHGRALERALDGVNATPQQRTEIKRVADAAAADLKAQREQGRGLRDQATALFTQPTVDANAAEALRQQMLSRHDQASKRLLQAALEISRVLTPEQRQQLAQRMEKRRAMMHRHMNERRSLEAPAPAR